MVGKFRIRRFLWERENHRNFYFNEFLHPKNLEVRRHGVISLSTYSVIGNNCGFRRKSCTLCTRPRPDNTDAYNLSPHNKEHAAPQQEIQQCQRPARRIVTPHFTRSDWKKTTRVCPSDLPLLPRRPSFRRGNAQNSPQNIHLYITQHVHGSPGESSSSSHATTWSWPFADASLKHPGLFQGHSSCLAHSRTANCPSLAALVVVAWSQGHPFRRAQRRREMWPPAAALAHVVASHEQPFCLAHWRTSRSPALAANSQV